MSNTLKGWNGLRLWPLRATAALMKFRSKWALWPTRIARWQPCRLTAARTWLNTWPSASRSGRARRKGWSRSMPVTSSDLGSISVPGAGMKCAQAVCPGTNRPCSSSSIGTAAISSSACRFQSKPPVSTSTTTGRNPRKRRAIALGGDAGSSADARASISLSVMRARVLHGRPWRGDGILPTEQRRRRRAQGEVALLVSSRFSRGSGGCSPCSRNQTFSAMLVAWSPIRSRFLAMNSRCVHGVMLRGSSIM